MLDRRPRPLPCFPAASCSLFPADFPVRKSPVAPICIPFQLSQRHLIPITLIIAARDVSDRGKRERERSNGGRPGEGEEKHGSLPISRNVSAAGAADRKCCNITATAAKF